MATNLATIKLLKRATKLIDELASINKVLKKHVGQQKRQPSRHGNDKYVYDKVKKTHKRA